MGDRISKVQRWLDLLTYLLGRRTPASVDQVMESVPAYRPRWRGGDETERASVRRVFEHDKRELRELGIPIETVDRVTEFGTNRGKAYVLAPGDFYLPYLQLLREASDDGSDARSDGEEGAAAAASRCATRDRCRAGKVEVGAEEARLAVDALRCVAELPGSPFAPEARSALRKLTFDLGPEVDGEGPFLHVAPGAVETEVAGTVRELLSAVEHGEWLRFEYLGISRNRPTSRHVAPYALFFRHGRWYLVGHDSGREDVRVFRVDRMEDVERESGGGGSPEFEIPPDFDAGAFLHRRAWELGERDPREVRVLFRYPASLHAKRGGWGRVVAEHADGSAIRRFSVVRKGPFLRWLLTFRGRAEILRPKDLRKELASLARRTAAVHGSRRAPDGRQKASGAGRPGRTRPPSRKDAAPGGKESGRMPGERER